MATPAERIPKPGGPLAVPDMAARRSAGPMVPDPADRPSDIQDSPLVAQAASIARHEANRVATGQPQAQQRTVPESATIRPGQAGPMATQGPSVSQRLSKLLSSDSPLLRGAGTVAKQRMGGRGLLNSSLAIGEVERARIDAAGPIAIEEARIDSEFALQERKAQIDKEMLTADTNRQMELLRERGRIDERLAGVRIEGESRLVQERGDIEKQLQTADAATRERLLNRQGEIDSELQGLRQKHERTLLERRAQIDSDLANAEGLRRLNLLKEQGRLDIELATLRAQAEERQIDQRGAIERQLLDRRGEIEAELATAEGERRKELLRLQSELDQQRDRLLHADRLDQIAADYNGRARIEGMRQSFQASENAADRQHNTYMREIINKHEKVIENNRLAAEFVSDYNRERAIINAGDGTAEEKDAAIDRAKDALNANLDFVETLADPDPPAKTVPGDDTETVTDDGEPTRTTDEVVTPDGPDLSGVGDDLAGPQVGDTRFQNGKAQYWDGSQWVTVDDGMGGY